MKLNVPVENELVTIIFFTFLAFMMMGLVLVIFFYLSRKKIVQKEIEKAELAIEYQKTLLHSVLSTQEEERKRIAQDLHDDISSKLNIVSLNSHLLKTANLTEKELDEIATNIINLTYKALENSRRIAHDLLPPVLEKFGLDAGIKELCLEFNSNKKAIVVYQNSIEFDTNDNQKHLHIFRILQELLNNSLRHGKATEIAITFKKIDNKNTCIYIDNGCGFDATNLESKKGLGMKNIESRISYINGFMTLESKPNHGMKMVFNF